MAVKECRVEEAVGSAEALTVVVYVLIRVASRKVGWRMQSGCEGRSRSILVRPSYCVSDGG